MMTTTASSSRLPGRLVRLVLLAVALAVGASLLLTGPASATEASSEAPGDSSSAVEEEVGEAEATEGGEGEGGEAAEGEGGGKLTISDNPHDQFGLVLFGLGGLAILAAIANAASQLKGKRPATDGRIRWR